MSGCEALTVEVENRLARELEERVVLNEFRTLISECSDHVQGIYTTLRLDEVQRPLQQSYDSCPSDTLAEKERVTVSGFYFQLTLNRSGSNFTISILIYDHCLCIMKTYSA